MAQSYFIVGTDTHVGKTYVASALIQHFVQAGLETLGMKPIASGCTLKDGGLWNEDVGSLQQSSNVVAPLALISPYRFYPAIAPHLAAKVAGVDVRLEVILSAYQKLTELADVVIVEGSGGFLVPINASATLADVAVHLQLPIILVVGLRLGCINHALLTVAAIEAHGLQLAGWVANQIDPTMLHQQENIDALAQRIHAPCLSVIGWQQPAQFQFI